MLIFGIKFNNFFRRQAKNLFFDIVAKYFFEFNLSACLFNLLEFDLVACNHRFFCLMAKSIGY